MPVTYGYFPSVSCAKLWIEMSFLSTKVFGNPFDLNLHLPVTNWIFINNVRWWSAGENQEWMARMMLAEAQAEIFYPE
jgi:hypothetical protein